MNAYIFQAALYCEECGEGIMVERLAGMLAGRLPIPPGFDLADETTYDSDDFPKGPFPAGGGESDFPQCCDACGEPLDNPLPLDGYALYCEEI